MEQVCNLKIKKMLLWPIWTPGENQMENVSAQRDEIMSHVICVLNMQTYPPGQFLFRGQKKSNLMKVLIKDKADYNEWTMYTHLFYYGMKAKWYYSSNGPSNYKRTNAVGIASIDEMFDYINTELRNIENKSFIADNEGLLCYFDEARNKALFTEKLKANPLFYRYYNFFLHTLGKRKKRPSAFLSSTKFYKTAEEFARDERYSDKEKYPIVLVSTLPKDKINGVFAMQAFHDVWDEYYQINKDLLQCKMPIFKGKWVYEKQQEIVLAYGMFPQYIWGVFDLEEKKVVVNPHMLEPKNKNQRRLHFEFDQTDFGKRLREQTNYWNGFYCDSWGLYPIIFP